MMARIIAADDQGKGVVEIKDYGYYVVAHSEHQKLGVGNYLGGWLNQPQDLEVEVRSVENPRRNSFKLSKLNWFPDAEQALKDLHSNSSATKLQIRVPPCRKPKAVPSHKN